MRKQRQKPSIGVEFAKHVSTLKIKIGDEVFQLKYNQQYQQQYN
jgi:hypothetical protein